LSERKTGWEQITNQSTTKFGGAVQRSGNLSPKKKAYSQTGVPRDQSYKERKSGGENRDSEKKKKK